MKKHLNLPVTASHVLQQQQFPADHETPTADLGMRPVPPWEETHLRKTTRFETVDETKRVPHSRLRAGQMVIDTQRAKDMAEKGIDASKESVLTKGEVQGWRLPDGDVMLRDGHHRVAADILKGRRSSVVHITGQMQVPRG